MPKQADPKAGLAQEVADRILGSDLVGRKAVAAELDIPASWVWVVRVAANLTDVRAEDVERCRAYLKTRGITVRARQSR